MIVEATFLFFILSTLLICYASLMQLLIQSGDIENNPGPIQRVIRGSFHQGDQKCGQRQVHSACVTPCI